MPSIEEIFDISPLYGSLHPGEAQKLKVTYYGHKEIKAHVRAVCEVMNGPNYDLMLRGEASVLDYEISSHMLNFDYIPFDKVSQGFIQIENLGKVSIEYSMVDTENSNSDFIEPDKPIIVPSKVTNFISEIYF